MGIRGVSRRVKGLEEQTATPSDSLSTFWALPTEQLLQELGTRPDGLTEQEAIERLRRYGANTLRRARFESKWVILLRQFTNPIVLILIGAASIAGCSAM